MALNNLLFLTFMLYILICKIFGQKYSCPPPTAVQVCYTTCRSDAECKNHYQCCSTACGGTYCVQPVTLRKTDNLVKPGSCPPPKRPWVCSNRCEYDRDCKGRAKCCKNVCGALACTLPSL